MRVGFFTDTFLPNIDGVVTSILDFRSFLKKEGHDVYVFSAGSQSDARLNEDPTVFFFRSLAFPPYPQYKLALFPYIGATRTAKQLDLDLVHCHAITSMGLASRHTSGQLKVPLVGTFHTMVTDGSSYFTKSQWLKTRASKVLWRAVSLFYKPFDSVMAPSHVTAGLLKSHGVNNVQVVPNGVDLGRFSTDLDSSVVRKLLRVAPHEDVVLVAGRLGFEKNVDVVIRSAKRILEKRAVRFIVTGDGPARKSLESLAVKEGVRHAFEFEGFVNKKALAYYFAAADVMVSASSFETQGLSVLEAMACGKPVVAANALALAEAVDDGKNGFLFEPFDEKDCAEKVVDVLSAGKKQKTLWSRSARKNAEQYSLEKSGKKLLAVYDSVL
jgi:1,2-diacylglycerol 3-alpha-glucosyltransferase